MIAEDMTTTTTTTTAEEGEATKEALSSNNKKYYFGTAPPENPEGQISEIIMNNNNYHHQEQQNNNNSKEDIVRERLQNRIPCPFKQKGCRVELTNPRAMKWHAENHQEFIGYLQWKRKTNSEGRRLYRRRHELNVQLTNLQTEIEQLKTSIENYENCDDTREIAMNLRDETLHRRVIQGLKTDSDRFEIYNMGPVPVTPKEWEFWNSLPKDNEEEEGDNSKLDFDAATKMRSKGVRIQTRGY